MKSLRERFEAFVSTLEGYESIDDLLRIADAQNKKRADYFLSNRQIIIEQKSLEIDPKDKPQNFINRLMEEGRFIAYGRHSTAHLFSRLPDGQDLQRRMILKITEVIEDNVETADKQTRDTREIFSVPDAMGILVILNEKAEMLDPELVAYSLSRAFQKKRADGSLRYFQNDGVLFISEAHSIALAGYKKSFPVMGFVGSNDETKERVSNFLGEIQRRWAQFNGLPLIEVPKELGATLIKKAKRCS